ncbi:platelet glycoprotein VI isoform X1 [Pan troglodytes]|uniref:platelet glycoprotein VI isoform X1 n=1 Tax=Pan troglodytes TaxID=9598 RepID=UPI00301328D7
MDLLSSPSPIDLPILDISWLCLGRVPAQSGPLPKPSLQALPSSLVPLEKPVTLRCQGPPGVDLYRLEKLSSSRYQDQAVLFIPAMKRSLAGRYRCSYQNGSLWSLPSDQLELIATVIPILTEQGSEAQIRREICLQGHQAPTGRTRICTQALGRVFAKPSLSAQPSPAVSSGGDVTLQCQTRYGFDQFALYKEGDPAPYKNPERWYRASFPIITVTAAHSGTYRCYSFSSRDPYLWSAPSDPLELVVTGPTATEHRFISFSDFPGSSVTPSRLPTEPPSSVAEFSEATAELTILFTNKVFTTETSRSITASPKESDSPAGPARQYYTKGNLVRICLGAVILILLAGFLAEDWHSRRKRLRHRGRAVQRPLPPLPPLPQTRKSHGGQDGGRPDVHSRGLCS